MTMLIRLLLIAAAGIIGISIWFNWRRKGRPVEFLSLALTLVIAGLICRMMLLAQTPLGASPDELAHFNYVAALSESGEIPVQESNVISGAETHDYEYYQPPLYYLSLAPIHRLAADSGATNGEIFLLLRLVQLLYWVLAAVMALLIAQKLWSAAPLVGGMLLALVTMLPSYISLSVSLNNDNLAIALAMVLSYLVIRSLTWLNAVITGIAAGLAIISKLSVAGVLIFAAAMLVLTFFRKPKERGQMIAKGLVIAALAAAIISPWILHNLNAYDSLFAEAVGSAPNYVVKGMPGPVRPFWAAGQISYTFWSVAGAKNQFHWLAGLGSLLSLIIIAGLVAWAFRHGKEWGSKLPDGLLIASGLALLFQFSLVMRMAMLYGQGQGRFLFPLFLALAVVISRAVSSLLSHPYLRDRTTSEMAAVHAAGLLLCYGLSHSAYVFGLFGAL